jgi:hypothetical protein
VLAGVVAVACRSTERPELGAGLGTGGSTSAGNAGTGGFVARAGLGNDGAAASGRGAGASSGRSAQGGTGGGAVISIGGGMTSGSAGLDPGASCAAEVHRGERIPVDIFVMLDISGSMKEPTSAGPTKWDAVNTALEDFLQSPESDGLGVGIQYFPLNAADAPASCTNDDQCGSYGPCLLNACEGAAPDLVACSTNTDCARGEGPCVPLGACQVSQGLCIDIGYPCGFDLGDPCVELGSSVCWAADCGRADYQTPAVSIAPLPGNGAALLASLRDQTPDGGTPTGPALEGATAYARAYATANPTHAVAVVLATDGLPTDCTPLDIPAISAIASNAFAGTPAVRTYVIGVFGPEDADAPANLNSIATAGGTDSAFIVDTTRDVASELTQALNAIRGTTLACDFEIPVPEHGGTLDYSRVNVEVADAGGSSTDLYYVTDAAGCDPALGGWYYDADPALGAQPTKISVCPSTCAAFKTITDGAVSIQLGCKTVVAPPR